MIAGFFIPASGAEKEYGPFNQNLSAVFTRLAEAARIAKAAQAGSLSEAVRSRWTSSTDLRSRVPPRRRFAAEQTLAGLKSIPAPLPGSDVAPQPNQNRRKPRKLQLLRSRACSMEDGSPAFSIFSSASVKQSLECTPLHIPRRSLKAFQASKSLQLLRTRTF